MKYQGGKTRIAKTLRDVILATTTSREVYVEPFLGGGSVAEYLVPHFSRSYLSDIQDDLMLLWLALRNDWEPPSDLSQDEYYSLKDSPPSALRGFAAYACSWGGKYWGGYGRDQIGSRNFADEGRRALIRKIGAMQTASFDCLDYRDVVVPPGSIVYCDPPYIGTTEYVASENFDAQEFVTIVSEWATHSTVFISEATQLSENWKSVWTGTAPVAGYNLKENRVESLFLA